MGLFSMICDPLVECHERKSRLLNRANAAVVSSLTNLERANTSLGLTHTEEGYRVQNNPRYLPHFPSGVRHFDNCGNRRDRERNRGVGVRGIELDANDAATREEA